MEFYRIPLEQLITLLKTDIGVGLTTKEAQKRLRKNGTNTLPGRPPERAVLLFLKQLNNAFSYLLIVAALLKCLVEGYRDAIIIGVIIMVNALVSAIQEGRASQTLAKLRSFLKTDCLVIRDGQTHIIDQTLLVPGDILILHEGMRVPADARLFEGHMLRIDESILTGESVPVTKTPGLTALPKAPLSEQSGMVFTGSTILSGHAHAIVVATGKKAEIGHLTCVIDKIETDMPLKRDLAHLSYFLLRAVIVIVVIFVLIGLLRGKDFAELVFTMTSLLVSIVPEGIPIVSTILMARNAYRMARSNVLVKRLQAIDGLGRLQVLVVDKTGTLTKNEQMVSALAVENSLYTVTGNGYEKSGAVYDLKGGVAQIKRETPLWYLGLAASLLDDAELSRDEKTGALRVRGEPIQAALGICAQKMGFDLETDQKTYPKIDEIPFAPETPLQKALFTFDGDKNLLVVMGSPERVADYCHQQSEPETGLQKMLSDGLRVVAIGYGFTTATQLTQTAGSAITTVGLWGLNDALRSDAAESIDAVQELGVRVLVATGDHLQTAIHVARATGLYQGPLSVQEGTAIEEKGDEEITVLARVTPQEKLKIISHLHQKNLLVGMTGDGVNDVPALVAADVGIAMGKSGTDVAKEAASIILLDDSLSSIAEGIMLGRHAFLTMRHVLIFVLATSASEILAFAATLIMNVPLPLSATQILWVHLLTDGLLTIALGMEPVDKKIAKIPLDPKARLIDRGMTRAFFLTSVPVAVITLVLFIYHLPEGLHTARSVALTALAMGQWWNAWNMRSETGSIFSQNPFSNIWLLTCTFLVVVAQIGALYLPFLQNILYTVPLSLSDFMLCLGVSSLVLVTEEVHKWWGRRRK